MSYQAGNGAASNPANDNPFAGLPELELDDNALFDFTQWEANQGTSSGAATSGQPQEVNGAFTLAGEASDADADGETDPEYEAGSTEQNLMNTPASPRGDSHGQGQIHTSVASSGAPAEDADIFVSGMPVSTSNWNDRPSGDEQAQGYSDAPPDYDALFAQLSSAGVELNLDAFFPRDDAVLFQDDSQQSLPRGNEGLMHPSPEPDNGEVNAQSSGPEQHTGGAAHHSDSGAPQVTTSSRSDMAPATSYANLNAAQIRQATANTLPDFQSSLAASSNAGQAFGGSAYSFGSSQAPALPASQIQQPAQYPQPMAPTLPTAAVPMQAVPPVLAGPTGQNRSEAWVTINEVPTPPAPATLNATAIAHWARIHAEVTNTSWRTSDGKRGFTKADLKFRSFQDAEKARKDGLRNWQPNPQIDPTFPWNDDMKSEYVVKIMQAEAEDSTELCIDKEKTRARVSNYWDQRRARLEQGAWQILNAIMKYQLGGGCDDDKGKRPNVLWRDNFYGQLQAVCTAISQSKTNAEQVSFLYPHKLSHFVDNPAACVHRSTTNRRGNEKKQVALDDFKEKNSNKRPREEEDEEDEDEDGSASEAPPAQRRKVTSSASTTAYGGSQQRSVDVMATSTGRMSGGQRYPYAPTRPVMHDSEVPSPIAAQFSSAAGGGNYGGQTTQSSLTGLEFSSTPSQGRRIAPRTSRVWQPTDTEQWDEPDANPPVPSHASQSIMEAADSNSRHSFDGTGLTGRHEQAGYGLPENAYVGYDKNRHHNGLDDKMQPSMPPSYPPHTQSGSGSSGIFHDSRTSGA